MTSSGLHREIAPGIDAWTFAYRHERRRQHGYADGLELFFQLDGAFGLRTPLRPRRQRIYAPGQLMMLDAGEAYGHAADGDGRQFGVTIRPDRLAALFGTRDDIHLPFEAGRDDRRLIELGRAATAGGGLDPQVLAGAAVEVIDFVRRYGDLRARDPLARAKAELECDPQDELYVHHLGELVGLHPATLRRNFRRRYGGTPVEFRLRMRLNRAAWLLWSSPSRPIATIGAEVGFVDESYFFRTFRRVVGLTPAQYRARHTGAAV